jgi:hypothetical protein
MNTLPVPIEAALRRLPVASRPFKGTDEARVLAVYAQPAFWRGAAEARNQQVVEDGDATAIVRLRVIEKALREGTALADIPAFKEWFDARFKAVRVRQLGRMAELP